MNYLCLGHASYDITFQMEGFPSENTKTRLDSTTSCGGGPASNAAYLLGKWGSTVSFAGLVGNDTYGKRIQNEFQTVGVDTSYLELSDLSNTVLSFIIANTKNGSRTILSSKDKDPLSLSLVPKEKYDVILLDGEEEQIAQKVLENNKEALTIIDAGSARESTISLCYQVKYIVCSHDFAEAVTGMKMNYDDKNTIIPIYRALKEKFHNEVLITLEGTGTFLEIDGTYKIIPSIPVKVVDSTGAGDIFHGAFTYFLSHGVTLEKTVRLANIAGALSVLKLGGRFSVPTLEEVLETERKYRDS